MSNSPTEPDGLKGPKNFKNWLKAAGAGTILFFTIKGVITTSLLLMGGSYFFKGCSG